MDGFKCLSSSIVEKYDYKRTKEKVDKFMAPLCEKIYEFSNLTPPTISSQIKEIFVQESRFNNNPTERYVLKKLTTEEEVKEYFEVIQSIVDSLNDIEKICFKAEYLSYLSIEKLVEASFLSESTIKRIRKSVIIKVALVLNLAVLKGKM